MTTAEKPMIARLPELEAITAPLGISTEIPDYARQPEDVLFDDFVGALSPFLDMRREAKPVQQKTADLGNIKASTLLKPHMHDRFQNTRKAMFRLTTKTGEVTDDRELTENITFVALTGARAIGQAKLYIETARESLVLPTLMAPLGITSDNVSKFINHPYDQYEATKLTLFVEKKTAKRAFGVGIAALKALDPSTFKSQD